MKGFRTWTVAAFITVILITAIADHGLILDHHRRMFRSSGNLATRLEGVLIRGILRAALIRV